MIRGKKPNIQYNKPFCKGICKEWKRQYKYCNVCKKRLCKPCVRIYRQTIWCPDCVIDVFDIKKDIKNTIIDVLRE